MATYGSIDSENSNPKKQDKPHHEPPSNVQSTSEQNDSESVRQAELERFEELNSRTMKPLLDATDLIQRAPLKPKSYQDEKLPQLVVVGDQSDGKSSLLELAFDVPLPKKVGIGTKNPIRIKVRDGDEWNAEVTDASGKEEFQDKEEFRKELTARMEKDVSHNPIHAAVCGPGLPNLNIVDLPGITRPNDDVEKKTASISAEFIRDERTIVMLVFKVTNEPDNSKALQFVKDTNRTVVILTHCDQKIGLERQEILRELIEKFPNAFAVICEEPGSSSTSREQRIEQGLVEMRQNECLPELEKSGKLKLGIAALQEELIAIYTREVGKHRADAKSMLRKIIKATEEELALQFDKEKILEPVEDALWELRNKIQVQVSGNDPDERHQLYDECREFWNGFGKDIQKETNLDDLRNKIKDEFKHQQGQEPDNLINSYPVIKRILGSFIKKCMKIAEENVRKCEEAIKKHVIQMINEQEGLKHFNWLRKRAEDDVSSTLRFDFIEILKQVESFLLSQMFMFRTPDWSELSMPQADSQHTDTIDESLKIVRDNKEYLRAFTSLVSHFCGIEIPNGLITYLVTSMDGNQEQPQSDKQTVEDKAYAEARLYYLEMLPRISVVVPQLIMCNMEQRLSKNLPKSISGIKGKEKERILSERMDTQRKKGLERWLGEAGVCMHKLE